MKRLKLERGKEELNSTGGNHLCGHFFARSRAGALCPRTSRAAAAMRSATAHILLTMTGMLCNSRTDFTDVGLYCDDTVFAQSFGIGGLPSESTLRQRMDELPAQRSQSALRRPEPIALEWPHFSARCARGIWILVPVDIDVSPLDNSGSHKQGVSFTYKKHDGYAPIFAYVGAEGYMLDHELRPGKQHCQEGNSEVHRRLRG